LIVGLRHDIDNVYGLRKGLPKVISIEEEYGVRSTFFVRVDIIRSFKDRTLLKEIKKRGWEIGLHLINTDGSLKKYLPKDELNYLKKLLDIEVHGVTPCGKTIGFKGEVTWKIMDSLNLKYMEGYGKPDFEVRTFVMPTHLSFDIYYVRKFGEKEGYKKFKKDLWLKLEKDGFATVLVHPEWFVRSVGGSGLKKLALTLLKKQMMNKVYNQFLNEFKMKITFMRYIDLYHHLNCVAI